METLIEDVIKACCEKAKSNEPTCSITLSNELYELNGDDDERGKVVAKISSGRPILDIEITDEFAKVDIIFRSMLEQDLKIIWNVLEGYGEQSKDDNIDNNNEHLLTLTIVPNKMDYKYYLTCFSPVFWTLVPIDMKSEFACVRIVFNKNDALVSETNGIDIEEIDKNIDQYIMEESEAEKRAIEKMEEENEYIYNRNEKIEQMRKNKQL